MGKSMTLTPEEQLKVIREKLAFWFFRDAEGVDDATAQAEWDDPEANGIEKSVYYETADSLLRDVLGDLCLPGEPASDKEIHTYIDHWNPLPTRLDGIAPKVLEFNLFRKIANLTHSKFVPIKDVPKEEKK